MELTEKDVEYFKKKMIRYSKNSSLREKLGREYNEVLKQYLMDCAKKEDEEPDPIIMVNPTIIASSEENSVYEEGCLSIPEHFAEITRPEFVQVEWIDLGGKQHSEEFNGLKSTCLQHEIDHLNGKLFIDYLKPMKRQMITRKMTKLKRELARG